MFDTDFWTIIDAVSVMLHTPVMVAYSVTVMDNGLFEEFRSFAKTIIIINMDYMNIHAEAALKQY
jgi:hypothetical protein